MAQNLAKQRLLAGIYRHQLHQLVNKFHNQAGAIEKAVTEAVAVVARDVQIGDVPAVFMDRADSRSWEPHGRDKIATGILRRFLHEQVDNANATQIVGYADEIRLGDYEVAIEGTAEQRATIRSLRKKLSKYTNERIVGAVCRWWTEDEPTQTDLKIVSVLSGETVKTVAEEEDRSFWLVDRDIGYLTERVVGRTEFALIAIENCWVLWEFLREHDEDPMQEEAVAYFKSV